MTDEDVVFALGSWKTNSQMIADVAKLGYFGKSGEESVLDMTYGRGNFWDDFKPRLLWANDLYVKPEHGGTMIDVMDLNSLLEVYTRDGDTFLDAVVCDVPYKFAGTPTPAEESSVDSRYGVTKYVPAKNTTELIRNSTRHASYLVKPGGFVLCKIQDQVVSGHVNWQTYGLVTWIEEYWNRPGGRHNLDLIGDFKFKSYRPQPSGRRQLNARRNYSTLLVFQRKAK